MEKSILVVSDIWEQAFKVMACHNKIKTVQLDELSSLSSPQAMLRVRPGQQRWGWHRHGDATRRHQAVQEADQRTNQIHPTGDVAWAQETSSEMPGVYWHTGNF